MKRQTIIEAALKAGHTEAEIGEAIRRMAERVNVNLTTVPLTPPGTPVGPKDPEVGRE